MLKRLLPLVLSGCALTAQDPGERFYQAIRSGDLATLRTLINEHGASVKDSRGETPLMFAGAFGSLEAMKLLLASGADARAISEFGVAALHWSTGDVRKSRLLLEAGADVNVRSQMGRTPLLVAAGTNGASETVKLLLAKGANANIADSTGITPLIAAANVNDTATVRLLLAAGADVNARSALSQTALMGGALNGNAQVVKMLLDRKAEIDVASAPASGITKNGPVQFGLITALHLAAVAGGAGAVELLLNAGASVDPLDVRGMTPLMSAVATDRPSPRVIDLLLKKGADPSIRSKLAENTFDWAKKFNNPPVLAALGLPAKAAIPLAANAAAATPREAVEKSLPLLQRSAASVLTDGGCVACHAQPVTGLAVGLARARGWRFDRPAAAASLTTVKVLRADGDQPLLQGREGGGLPDTLVYSAWLLAAEKTPPSRSTDALVHYLAAKQRAAGNWRGVGASRAPIVDGDFSRTALSIRAFATFAMPGRKAEFAERIARAAAWLAAQTPVTTEDRVMQLLGLKWAGAAAALRDARVRELIAARRADGGWAQTPHLASDAYATGQVLVTLHESGISADNPAFRRGADFLLRTQATDGSWYVKSRATKIQPYFESGFPYGHDQWISATATAWAAMALSLTAPDQPVVARAARSR